MLDRNALHRIYAGHVTDGAPTPEDHLTGLEAVAMAARVEMIGAPPTLLATMPSSVLFPDTNGTIELWSGKAPSEPSGKPPVEPAREVEAILGRLDLAAQRNHTPHMTGLCRDAAAALRGTMAERDKAHARAWAPAKTYRERAEKAEAQAHETADLLVQAQRRIETAEAELAEARKALAERDALDASSIVDGLVLPLRIGTADHVGEAAYIGDVRSLANVVEELLRREIARLA